MRKLPFLTTVVICCFGFTTTAVALVGDPWADVIIDYDLGVGGAEGFDNPFTVLGSPERFTGEGVFPSVVSPFSPAFGIDELVSIGTGGFLTIAFNTPVTNDAANPFGIDLLVFGNTGFIDSSWPNGIVGGLFGNDGGIIQVSDDGEDWRTIKDIEADSMFPTMGYLDSGPYDTKPGNKHTDFTKPVDPSLTFNDFNGQDYSGILDMYDGSGGGVGVDIASVGLESISFVRILNEGSANVEIEAFADVAAIPSPSAMAAIGLCGIIGFKRRNRDKN